MGATCAKSVCCCCSDDSSSDALSVYQPPLLSDFQSNGGSTNTSPSNSSPTPRRVSSSWFRRSRLTRTLDTNQGHVETKVAGSSSASFGKLGHPSLSPHSIEDEKRYMRRRFSEGNSVTGQVSTQPDFGSLECVICFDEFTSAAPQVNTLCQCGENKQAYHLKCLQDWQRLSGNKKCVLCDTELYYEDVTGVQEARVGTVKKNRTASNSRPRWAHLFPLYGFGTGSDDESSASDYEDSLHHGIGEEIKNQDAADVFYGDEEDLANVFIAVQGGGDNVMADVEGDTFEGEEESFVGESQSSSDEESNVGDDQSSLSGDEEALSSSENEDSEVSSDDDDMNDSNSEVENSSDDDMDGSNSEVENSSNVDMDGSSSEVESFSIVDMDGSNSEVENSSNVDMDGSNSEAENSSNVDMDGSNSEVENSSNDDMDGSTSEVENSSNDDMDGSSSEQKNSEHSPNDDLNHSNNEVSNTSTHCDHDGSSNTPGKSDAVAGSSCDVEVSVENTSSNIENGADDDTGVTGSRSANGMEEHVREDQNTCDISTHDSPNENDHGQTSENN